MNDATRDNPAVAAEAAATNPNGKRKKLLATVIGAFVAAGLAYGAYWAIVARHVESTDDA
jgi:membrane fusion protein, multidrug efflux system